MDGRIKARTCTNGNVQRALIKKYDKSIHTEYLEIIMLTSVIYVKTNLDVSTIDIPNSLSHKPIDSKPVEERIIMKIKVVLVDMLVHMNP